MFRESQPQYSERALMAFGNKLKTRRQFIAGSAALLLGTGATQLAIQGSRQVETQSSPFQAQKEPMEATSAQLPADPVAPQTAEIPVIQPAVTPESGTSKRLTKEERAARQKKRRIKNEEFVSQCDNLSNYDSVVDTSRTVVDSVVTEHINPMYAQNIALEYEPAGRDFEEYYHSYTTGTLSGHETFGSTVFTLEGSDCSFLSTELNFWLDKNSQWLDHLSLTQFRSVVQGFFNIPEPDSVTSFTTSEHLLRMGSQKNPSYLPWISISYTNSRGEEINIDCRGSSFHLKVSSSPNTITA